MKDFPKDEALDDIKNKYKDGCHNNKNPDDCFAYAQFLSKSKDFVQSVRLHRLNCNDYKYASSCIEYANVALVGSKKNNVRPDISEAVKYFTRACELGNAAGCTNVGMLVTSPYLNNTGLPREYARGIEMLTKSCRDMGHGNACFYLAGMYMAGVNADVKEFGLDDKKKAEAKPDSFVLAKDMKTAFELTQKACDLNVWQACENLSAWHTSGEHAAKNLEKAQHYKKAAEKLREEEKHMNLFKSFH